MINSQYGHMVHEYYVARLRAICSERNKRLAGIKNRADAEKYVTNVRKSVRSCFAPFPVRSPLNAQVRGNELRDGFRVEKITYESRPNFMVTGNLYLPSKLTEKAPAVLGLCGHSQNGKIGYQIFVNGLVRNGFVVFIIDPISQGERRQFYPNDGGPRPGHCHAHNIMGNAMGLVDDFFGTWRVWDAIRGLDYLLSRPEVDKKCIGVTGNSGGGTLSTYVAALDPRPTMVAVSCHMGSFNTDLENELPRDSEQNPPGLLKAGLDSADLLLCHAPRPTLVLSQQDDFFDARAAKQACKEVKRIHSLLGSRDSAALFEGPRNHGYHQENREAMVEFFLHHAGKSGSSKEEEWKRIPDKELLVTPKGETYPEGSRRVFDFTADTAKSLKKTRPNLTTEKLKTQVRKVLNLPKSKGIPHYRVLRDRCFAVETEPGIQVMLKMGAEATHDHLLPTGKLTLYVGDTSSEEDIQQLKQLHTRATEVGFLSVDLRGLGRSMPQTCNTQKFFDPYGSDFLYASTGELLGESYLGRRVFDLLRVMDLCLANGGVEITLVGRGLGSVITAFAGLLHSSRPRVEIFNYLPSYNLLAETPLSSWPLSVMPRGILKYFDLPDIYRALGKRLSKKDAWNENME